MEENYKFQVKEFTSAVYEGELQNGLQHGFGC
jgi:hypothetical protein